MREIPLGLVGGVLAFLGVGGFLIYLGIEHAVLVARFHLKRGLDLIEEGQEALRAHVGEGGVVDEEMARMEKETMAQAEHAQALLRGLERELQGDVQPQKETDSRRR